MAPSVNVSSSTSSPETSKHALSIRGYYNLLESRIGWRFLMGGTRHFGYYDSPKSSPFPMSVALRRMEDNLIASLPANSEECEVLDAGCGVGHVAIRVASRGYQVQGIDLVDHHLEKARRNIRARNLQHRIIVQKGNYHDLSMFESNRFGGVYTCETFVHSINPSKALSEFYRVLKPGGKLVMREYDHADFDDMPKDMARALTMVNSLSFMPGAQMFGDGILKKLISEAGFEQVEVKDLSDHIIPLPWFFYVLAYVPYIFIRLLGLESKFPNASCAVLAYGALQSGYGRYVAVSAVKPIDEFQRQRSFVNNN